MTKFITAIVLSLALLSSGCAYHPVKSNVQERFCPNWKVEGGGHWCAPGEVDQASFMESRYLPPTTYERFLIWMAGTPGSGSGSSSTSYVYIMNPR